jgi:CHASE3 domain sensor protein
MKDGFVTLIGLLLAVLLMGFWFVSKNSDSTTQKTQTETYDQSIQKAEDIKNILEQKNLGIEQSLN